jgi:hypothetical protein
MPIRATLLAVIICCASHLAQAQPTSAPAVVDASTLRGKVICGYQGWFNTPGDGAHRGWIHWGRGEMQPGSVNVDLLPDMTEFGADERFVTGLRLPDGTPLEVFSSYNATTVQRHFRWMRDYGIDGVFLQRFASDVADRNALRHCDQVARNVIDGATENGRVFGMMYDLSGLREAQIDRVINDWKHLVDNLKVTSGARYIHDGGKPVVALWGFGFNDGRDPLVGEGGMRLIKFLKEDPTYGGNSVMLGVPSGWRTLDRDAVNDPALHRIIEAADIVNPWTVGRYSTPAQAQEHARKNWTPDLAWCKQRGKQYLPVVFPGFSWHNLRDGKSPLNQIPRLEGRFL